MYTLTDLGLTIHINISSQPPEQNWIGTQTSYFIRPTSFIVKWQSHVLLWCFYLYCLFFCLSVCHL